jgi:protoporphyrinogen/coproporphyrinogen III oxidase
MSPSRIVVIGGGITGLTAAYQVRQNLPQATITLFESDTYLGGKIRSSPFAGHDSIDEGADAFLTRIPHAITLADELGLTDQLTSPAVSSANVWFNGMHAIPEGLLLGVPTDLAKLARSRLISWPAKLRAGLEPILPATGVGADSVGRLIRKRFGKQVHERLVDPLVGSIYAADTDRFSLAGVPQILDLAAHNRSLLIGARRARRKAPPMTGPIFAAPLGGMSQLTGVLAQYLRSNGVSICLDQAAERLEPTKDGWQVNDKVADGVIVATPAKLAAPLIANVSAEAAAALGRFDHAGVVMITLAVDAKDWPSHLTDRSGYLVPKPVQQWVTAVSFASTKWAHWANQNSVILRVSLGRDGRDLTGETDQALLAATLVELSRHLGFQINPTEHRITRWPLAFPQYRPGHAQNVTAIDLALERDAPGVFLAGASYRGIGIPACIADGKKTANTVCAFLNATRD